MQSIFSNSILDIILILISASACFYCALLSRRLKALNKLDVGVGASIVSLTEAIGKTHEAAREAQTSTEETVRTLAVLLERSESMAPVLEASMTEITRSLSTIQALKTEINTELKPELSDAAARARNVAADIISTVKAVEQYRGLQTLKAKRSNPKPQNNSKLADSSASLEQVSPQINTSQSKIAS